MPQYPNNQNQANHKPSTERCTKCPHKLGCLEYIHYLENIAQSPTAFPVGNTDVSTAVSDIDFTQIIQSNKELKDSILEVILSKFQIFESYYNNINEFIAGIDKQFEKLNKLEKIDKLDKLIAMIDVYETQNSPENGELTVYNGDINETGKTLIEKKGLFGIGKKWAEEDLDKVKNRK